MNEKPEQECVVCDEEIRLLEERVAESEGVERATALMALADFAFFAERWDLALASVGACLELLPPGEFPEFEAESRRKLGCVLAELTRYGEAIEEMVRARKIFSSLEDACGVARCMRLEGSLAVNLGRPDEAIKLFKTAAQKFRDIDHLADAASCDFDLAKELEKLGDYDAIKHFDDAAEGFAATGLPEQVAECEAAVGRIYMSSKNMEYRALEHFARATIIFGSCGQHLEAIRCKDDMGWLASRQNLPKRALELHKECRPILAKLGTADEVAQCDMRWGFALKDLGRFKQAMTKLRSALRAFQKLGDEVEAAACEDYLGMCLQGLGKYEEAIEHHRNAMEIFEHHEMRRDANMCEYYLETALEALADRASQDGSNNVVPLRKRRT